MKKNEKIKYLLIGFTISIMLMLFLNARILESNGEVGRYQVSSAAADGTGMNYAVILDTKTGEYLIGWPTLKGLQFWKGDFAKSMELAKEKYRE